jgi:hypothetical protein
MAGIKFHPEDWAEMLQAVRDWAAANVPQASTDPSWYVAFGKRVPSAPQPPKPFVAINILVGPIQDGQGDSAAALFSGVAVVVKNVINSQLYRVVYDGMNADFTSDASATRQEILTGLIASVNAVAGSAVASQVLDVVHISGDETVDVDADPNLALRRISSTESEGTVTFQVDCIGRDDAEGSGLPGPMFESVAAASALRLSLETEEALEGLRNAGWAFITVEGERKPDLVVGSVWEDRSGFDVRLRCRMRDLRLGDFIESAEVGTSIVGTLSH